MNGSNHIKQEVKILYVEDETATRLQVLRILQQNGYRCIPAENGQQGIELFKTDKPDIVLSDIMMPEMNGLDMAKKIREISPDIPLIIMTCYDDSDYMKEAIEIGINQFVIKPVDISKLLAAVAKCVKLINLRYEADRARYLKFVGILAGGMAHDFNNLLQVILGYISLAKNIAEPGSKIYEYLSFADKGSLQAKELGEKLLLLAKGGMATITTKPINPIIKSVLEQKISKTIIKYEFNYPQNLPNCSFDEEQIRIVFENLCDNALEAMPEGGNLNISVAVEKNPELQDFAKADDNCDFIHILFSDNGHGISAENISKIFDPYFTTKECKCHKGQGLGLGVCYAILQKHGGKIDVESSRESGSTFHIWLPVSKESGCI